MVSRIDVSGLAGILSRSAMGWLKSRIGCAGPDIGLIRTLVVVVALIVTCLASDPVSAATVSGTVTIPGGHGVRASLTIHDLSTPRTAGQKPFDHQFASKADGTFSLSGVPAGTYRICVDAPQANVLDPCLWSATQQTWTVTASQAVTGVAIAVQTGAMLRVHVNDPQAALPQAQGGIHGNALTIAVETDRKQHLNLRQLPAASAVASASGFDDYLIVPFDETLTLVTESASVALSDQNGKALKGNAQTIAVHIPSGGSLAPVVLNVAPTAAAK